MELAGYIDKLEQYEHLTVEEAEALFHALIRDAGAKGVQKCLELLHIKGETASELEGFIRGMRSIQAPITLKNPLLDIVGGGRDGANTVNISTGAAIVAAACGAKVAKHGSHSSSAHCSSADLFKMCGMEPEFASKFAPATLEEYNICFLYTDYFYPALKVIEPVLRKMRKKSIFNLIGPVINPAAADHFVLGVGDARWLDIYADLLERIGVKRALVVHGAGLDEMSPIGPADIIEIREGERHKYLFDPKTVGMKRCKIDDLKGGEPRINAHQMLRVFENHEGPIFDSFALGAGAGLYVYGKASSIEEGIEKARTALHKGEAFDLLNAWVEYVHVRSPR